MVRCPSTSLPSYCRLLEFGLQVGGCTVRHFDFKLLLLALADERMPSHDFVLAGRHVLDLERPVILHDGEVRARDRKEEGLHELMLVALQAIEPILLSAAAEGDRLFQLVALLGKTDVETGRRGRALLR